MAKPVGTVEVKGFVSPELKTAFIAKCAQEGHSQTWVITQLIMAYLDDEARRVRPQSGKPKRGKASK